LQLLLNPCLGGSNANQGFRGFNFESDVLPSANAEANSSTDLYPNAIISSEVIFL
jgi:hypothetical protein